jgi:hypothetical protein
MESPFPQVYLITSKFSLPHLDETLSQYGELGYLRVVYVNGKETNNTIAIMSLKTYQAACEAGYSAQDPASAKSGIRIAPYLFKNNETDSTSRQLFVPVPSVFSAVDTVIVAVVGDKLKHLAEWDILPDKSWNFGIPIKSREEGEVKGSCYITFNEQVSQVQIQLVRVLLNDTHWPEVNGHKRATFKCYWAKEKGRKSEGRRLGVLQSDIRHQGTRQSEGRRTPNNKGRPEGERRPERPNNQKKRGAKNQSQSIVVVRDEPSDPKPQVNILPPLCPRPVVDEKKSRDEKNEAKQDENEDQKPKKLSIPIPIPKPTNGTKRNLIVVPKALEKEELAYCKVPEIVQPEIIVDSSVQSAEKKDE